MAYKEIEPSIWKPEKDGDFIEGILIRSQSDVGENKSMLYGIETPEGVKNVWGSAVLDERMSFASAGNKVRITFKGVAKETRKGRNPAKIFKVEVDKE